MKIPSHGKLLLLLAFLSVALFGEATLSVDKIAIYSGDAVTFTLKADGGKINLPTIASIEEFPIIGTADASSIAMINGDTTKSFSRRYTFVPTHDVTIPSFELTIDGKVYTTPSQKITVLTPKASANGEPFVMALRANKTSAYVGEPITLNVAFKQQVDAKVDKIEVAAPVLKDFWVKKSDVVQKEVDGEYITQSYHYILFPKKEGNFTIPAIFARAGVIVRADSGLGSMDKFFNDPMFATRQIKWQKVFSNDVSVHVKALPEHVYLYGDFTIETKVDKTEADANKPVNVTLSIKGSGNIEDLPKFNPQIKDVSLYVDEPKIEASLEKGEYKGEFSEHIAIVADKDYVIPPFSISYFDANEHKVVTKSTKEMPIHIVGASLDAQKPKLETKQQPTIETNLPEVKPQIQKKNFMSYVIIALVGAIFLIGLFFLLRRYKSIKKGKESNLLSAVKKARSDKELFDALLPYVKEHKIIGEVLKQLEENIYRGAKNKIDKKALVDFLESVGLFKDITLK